MFDDALSTMDNALFSAFSKTGVYNQTYIVDVVLDVDVMRANDMDFSRNAFELTFLRDQVNDQKQGDEIDINGTVYTLTTPVQGDEGVVIWAANARSR